MIPFDLTKLTHEERIIWEDWEWNGNISMDAKEQFYRHCIELYKDKPEMIELYKRKIIRNSLS